MAQNYTQFCLALTVSPEEASWLTERLDVDELDVETAEGMNLAKQYEEEGWVSVDDGLWTICSHSYDEQENTIFLFDDGESGDLERLAELLCSWASRFGRTEEIIACEYSVSCSKPRPGEFGGGVFIVHRNNVRWWTTWQFVVEYAKEAEQ